MTEYYGTLREAIDAAKLDISSNPVAYSDKMYIYKNIARSLDDPQAGFWFIRETIWHNYAHFGDPNCRFAATLQKTGEWIVDLDLMFEIKYNEYRAEFNGRPPLNYHQWYSQIALDEVKSYYDDFQ